MTLITYPTTALEDWVTNFYLRLCIRLPHQIDENIIARRLNIFIHRKKEEPSFLIMGRYKGITVDIRESYELQRIQFFHELCHILRHAGTQSMIPEALRQLQEWDACNFVLYAAIPHHMLELIDLYHEDVISYMTYLFKTSPELAEQRLQQIKRRSW